MQHLGSPGGICQLKACCLVWSMCRLYWLHFVKQEGLVAAQCIGMVPMAWSAADGIVRQLEFCAAGEIWRCGWHVVLQRVGVAACV